VGIEKNPACPGQDSLLDNAVAAPAAPQLVTGSDTGLKTGIVAFIFLDSPHQLGLFQLGCFNAVFLGNLSNLYYSHTNTLLSKKFLNANLSHSRREMTGIIPLQGSAPFGESLHPNLYMRKKNPLVKQ
jgi:hypothetical protein